jgi:hypothetical protein
MNDGGLVVVQEVPIQQVAPAADTKLAEIQRHLEEINIDFKENIMRKVEMLKLKDTDELQRRVDTVKREESLAVQRLNKEYMQREEREALVLEKHKAKKQLLMRIVAQWEGNKRKRALFQAWKLRTQAKARECHQGDYCHAFFLQGLKQRGFKAFKLYAQVAGNRMYERRVKERIHIDIRTRVEERQNEKEFLVAMIRELEEQLRIELPVEYLALDVVDTSTLDSNVHELRHCYFNLNAFIVDDLAEIVTTRRRACMRRRLTATSGNVWVFLAAPGHIDAV